MAHDKDPFAEYDKYWDELDKIEESNQMSEPSFEDHSTNDHKSNLNQSKRNGVSIIMIIIGIVIFSRVLVSDSGTLFGMPVIFFFIALIIIINIIKKTGGQ